MSLKIIGAIVGVIVLVLVGVVALMFTGIIPNPLIGPFLDPPEHSARYYPTDTMAYGWVSLYPEGGQRDQMMDLWERFNELPAVEEQIEEFQEDFEDQTGMTIEDDVMPWIGAELSAGLFEERGEFAGVITVAVRDSGAAEEFVDDLIDYLEDEEGMDFDLDEDDGVTIWVDEIGGVALALTDDVLLSVFSEEPEDALEKLLETISGEEERSLAGEENFQTARSKLTGRRFASTYINVEELVDFLEESGIYSSDLETVTAAADAAGIPDWAAGSAQWLDRGIVVEALVPNTEDFTSELQVLDNPAELVPAQTVGLLAATFDPSLDNWREQLEDYGSDDDISYFIEDIYEDLYWEVEQQSSDPPRRRDNPDMADVLDLFLELVEAYTDVDLEGDVMDYLEGTLVLAIEEFDARRIEEDPIEETVNVVALLSYLSEEESRLENALEDFSDFLQDEAPVDVDSEDVGADNDAEIFRVDFFGIETDYAPGYVLHNGHLIFGTTEEALVNTVAAQNGDLDDLASLDEFQRSVGALPRDRQFLVWLDLQRIITEMSAGDLDLTDNAFEALEASLGSIAAGAKADEEIIRVGLAITLFPE